MAKAMRRYESKKYDADADIIPQPEFSPIAWLIAFSSEDEIEKMSPTDETSAALREIDRLQISGDYEEERERLRTAYQTHTRLCEEIDAENARRRRAHHPALLAMILRRNVPVIDPEVRALLD